MGVKRQFQNGLAVFLAYETAAVGGGTGFTGRAGVPEGVPSSVTKDKLAAQG